MNGTPHAEFQAAVHYTSQHLERLNPIRLRFLGLVQFDRGYYLVPTKPLIRPMEYVPLGSLDEKPPKGWTKPTESWDVLLDAAGGGPCLVHLDEGELYHAALDVCRRDFAGDLYGAQTLVKQLHVLLAARLGIKVSSFAELPGIDEEERAEVLKDLAAQRMLVPNGEEESWARGVARLDAHLDAMEPDDFAPDRGAFTDNNPKRRRSQR